MYIYYLNIDFIFYKNEVIFEERIMCYKYMKWCVFLSFVLTVSACKDTPPPPVNNEGRCSFSDIELPNNAEVYAVGVYSGENIIYQIDETSFSQPTGVDIYINEPDKPAILLLVGNHVNVWQIKRTPKTKIIAVYAGNYNKTWVLGLGEHIPIITATKVGKECEGIDHQYDYGDSYMKKFDSIAAKFLNRPISQKIAKHGSPTVVTSLYVGKQLPDSEYTQDKVTPIESLRVLDTPLAGKAGLDDAVRKGLIREVAQEELTQWYREGAFPELYWRNIYLDRKELITIREPVYFILQPFQIPVGLFGADAAYFILPKGVPMPTGYLGHSKLINFDTKECFEQQADGLKLTSYCSF